MNIRHNNCDASDQSKYVHQFATLSEEEKEEWYDTIYEQALLLYVLLDSQTRNKKIKDFKSFVES